MSGDKVNDTYKELYLKFYTALKKVNYGAKYFKDHPDADTTTKQSYSKILDDVFVAYSQLCHASENNQIPGMIELDFKGPGFILHEGILYGNVDSARSYASKVNGNAQNTPDGYKEFIISVYIKACLDSEKRVFIEIPEEIKNIYGDSKPVKIPVVNHVETILNPLDIFCNSKCV